MAVYWANLRIISKLTYKFQHRRWNLYVRSFATLRQKVNILL